MTPLIFLSIMLGISLLAGLLYYEKWKPKHILSVVVSIAFMSLFAVYSSQILTPFWPGANASDLWLATFLIMYLGGALIAFIPFLLDGIQKRDLLRLWKLVRIWLVLGLIYTVTDNVLYPPYAIGSDSYYMNKDLCTISPAGSSVDVFIGCQMQRLGFNPFTDIAGHVVYFWFSILTLLLVIWLLGGKKIEKLVFNGEFQK